MPIENPGPAVTGTGAGIVAEHQHVTPPRNQLQGWRERFDQLGIAIHPVAKSFPELSDEELAELGRDIEQNGLRHPIVFYCDRTRRSRKDYPRQSELILIDGRTRLTAMERAGISLFDESGRFNPDIETDHHEDPVEIRWRDIEGTNLFDPVAYIVSVNVRRRHLTREQKRELVEHLLKANPERSDNATAKLAKVSDKTVNAVRHELEGRSEIPNVVTRTDTAGRQQPARKLSPHARAITPEKLEEIRAEAPHETDPPATIDQLADRKDALRAFDDTIRLLCQRSAEVLALPRQMRVGRAMQMLDALGVSASDLVPAVRR